MRSRLIERATAPGGVREGADPTRIAFQGGEMRPEGRAAPLGAAFDGVMFGLVAERGSWRPAGVSLDTAREFCRRGTGGCRGFALEEVIRSAFGAQFVEVAVHARTGEVRVPRMVGALAAGRILDERLARSQLVGGVIWGVGSALHEATEVDPRHARFVDTDLGECLVAVNADVPRVEVEIVPKTGRIVNPLGVKGIGEIGITGVNAAVANAVHHATGRRLRETPIRMEHLIG